RQNDAAMVQLFGVAFYFGEKCKPFEDGREQVNQSKERRSSGVVDVEQVQKPRRPFRVRWSAEHFSAPRFEIIDNRAAFSINCDCKCGQQGSQRARQAERVLQFMKE